jgi:hypothetical protein
MYILGIKEKHILLVYRREVVVIEGKSKKKYKRRWIVWII